MKALTIMFKAALACGLLVLVGMFAPALAFFWCVGCGLREIYKILDEILD